MANEETEQMIVEAVFGDLADDRVGAVLVGVPRSHRVEPGHQTLVHGGIDVLLLP